MTDEELARRVLERLGGTPEVDELRIEIAHWLLFPRTRMPSTLQHCPPPEAFPDDDPDDWAKLDNGGAPEAVDSDESARRDVFDDDRWL